MLEAQEGGDSLTREELSTSVIGLFGAGFETTAHMIGNGMYLLGKSVSGQSWRDWRGRSFSRSW